MKIIAYYLPQFHQIPENDVWWGTGFTDWENVKKAKALFKGHNQPRIPRDMNYYDLSSLSILKAQIDIAKENHIWGFCFYHYWFGSRLLLQKPMEMLLHNKELNMPFCISWANENWTNQWVSNNPRILIEQKYGNQDEWEQHFDYLLPFFKDNRYIKERNKPIIIIYKPYKFERINEMINSWDELAKRNGFNGICFMSQISYRAEQVPQYYKKMNYLIDYQPSDVFVELTRTKSVFIKSIKEFLKRAFELVGLDLEGRKIPGLKKYDYSMIWERVLNKKPVDMRTVPGAFKDWDNTPRKGRRGTVLTGVSVERFKKYFYLQVRNCRQNYKKDFMFFFAWNEWAEGGYLEPDTLDGKSFLSAIKDVLEELDEVPLPDEFNL